MSRQSLARLSWKSGEPDDPGQTFDELYDWKRDDFGVPCWQKKARRHLMSTCRKTSGTKPSPATQRDMWIPVGCVRPRRLLHRASSLTRIGGCIFALIIIPKFLVTVHADESATEISGDTCGYMWVAGPSPNTRLSRPVPGQCLVVCGTRALSFRSSTVCTACATGLGVLWIQEDGS